MKVQCSCGAKYAFDVTPEMARNPVQLVCQTCGTDISSFVNELIRQQLQPAEPAPSQPEPQASPAPAASGKLRVRASTAAPIQTESSPEPTDELPVCLKHPSHRATHKCHICQKPICPECMALFGFVCSPHCKAKASANGIEIPVYAGQRSIVQARQWRKVGWSAAGIGAMLLALVGVWIWYLYVGSLPKPYFSVRFPERARSGESVFSGKDQIIFRHGPTLARYDTKHNKQIWSRELVTKKEIESRHSKLSAENLADYLAWAANDLKLKVSGQNVWIAAPGKLTRYDWDTGEPKQEIPLIGDGEAVLHGDEVLLIGNRPGNRSIGHISLANGEKRVEEIHEPAAAGKPRKSTLATAKAADRKASAGLPVRAPGKNSNAPLDPAEVAAHVQSLSYPARVALPAVLANTLQQERILAEINEQEGKRPVANEKDDPTFAEDFSLIPMKEGCLQFSARLLERRIVVHTAMKAKPAKSALDGNVRATDSAAVANEILNEMQRDRGGDQVSEDQSRYSVTLRRADAKGSSDWTGEVVGPPGIMPLETVNVLAAGNTIRVFNQANKKLWEQTLTFIVPINSFGFDESSSSGAGPCVERDGTLYVADQGVLSAFDLANGNARWRLPTVGITGMFFDDSGMIYVNTTTAGHDTIKHSRQIDVTQKIDPIVLKIDPRVGKTLWSAKPLGFINYISGKFIYVVTSFAGDFDEKGRSLRRRDRF